MRSKVVHLLFNSMLVVLLLGILVLPVGSMGLI